MRHLTVPRLGGFILAGLVASCTPPRPNLQSQLEREILALSQRMTLLEEELATCGTPGAEGSLYAELFQIISPSMAQIDQRGPATVVTFRGSKLFTDDWGSEINPGFDNTLDLLTTALHIHPEYDVTIVGHASTAPIPAPHNRRYFNHMALSLGLAAKLTDHLVTNYTVEAERFTVAGRGTWDPVASNELPDGRDQNHRVEIWLVRSITNPGTNF